MDPSPWEEGLSEWRLDLSDLTLGDTEELDTGTGIPLGLGLGGLGFTGPG